MQDNAELSPDLRHPAGGPGFDVSRFNDCALIARPSHWSRELSRLGVQTFKRPEGLYKALRNRTLLPAVCIVDLDAVPRNLVRAVDVRIPCPKIWIGRAAANPADIKNFGVYYSKAQPEELNTVAGVLSRVERDMALPSTIVGKQTLPLLVADDGFRERLLHYTDLFTNANLITLHGDDPLEIQLVAQYLAVETRRSRIWEVRSEASIHSILRKIAQARRPGTDVTIVVSRDIDIESARELYKSMPAEYSMIKLSTRTANPMDSLSFTLPKAGERPADIESWIIWFICRSTIEHGVALSGLCELVVSIRSELRDNPTIEQIRDASERSVRQHATIMEDRGEFLSYDDLVHNFERTVLRQALDQHDWNFSATAKSLGLAESSLRYKLNKLGISRMESQGSGRQGPD